MSGPRRDCFDWPQRPQLQGALSAQPAPVAPARAAAGAPGAARGVLPTLLTLAALISLPVLLFAGAWALIELMTQIPLFYLGVCLFVLAAWCWSMCLACKRPWRIEDDGCMVITTLFETRFER